MTDAPKSAFEIAMERLRKKDAEDGIAELTLTDEQREEIAEIRRVYAARLAEREILHKSALATTWEPDARQKLEETYAHDVQRLKDAREAKVAAARGGH